ncbi:MAG: peptidoglycan -binding protein [Reyranellaceae bacterium]
MASLSRRSRNNEYTWPGYVDALSSLLMVVIFVLAIFVVAQFYLSEALGTRDQALDRLNRQMAELASLLQLEQRTSADLRATIAALSAELQKSTAERDRLQGQVSQLGAERDSLAGRVTELGAERDSLAGQVSQLGAERDALAGQVTQLGAERGKALAELTEQQRLSAEAKATIDRLSANIAALQAELARLNAALEASEAKAKEQNAQIVDLSNKLNRALVSKVEELARYRSEFFGRLREILGNRSDIVIVGDRFVFQSEVLFASGSAELEPRGLIQIANVADVLKEIGEKIPAGIDWILQVDGHTDTRPIRTPQFRSNWELSSARAIAVVEFLHSRGIPYERLAARGFAEFQPLESGSDQASLAKNRRIELKITTR